VVSDEREARKACQSAKSLFYSFFFVMGHLAKEEFLRCEEAHANIVSELAIGAGKVSWLA
jgi:hypothetical protein